ncbi:hypothetical protein ACFFNY_05630 [Paenibacillus hodogayensis]|uniref:Glycosyltransferase RgtA/B/C/D-like domain-containing protein n=1 Tax=Paenibacillus hodogayensis TaxID=279208 RepID=A0ABV5VRY7_9BACL
MRSEKLMVFYLACAVMLLSKGIYLVSGYIWSSIHDSHMSIFDILNQGHSGWYASVIENGYLKEPTTEEGITANSAFFSLYPLLVTGLVKISNLSTNQAGAVLSTAFLTVALYYTYRYVSLTRGKISATTAILLIALGPYSFYFSALSTDSLFILLVILSFYFLEQKRWIMSGIIGALLSFTRPLGVVILIPLIFKMFLESQRKGEKPREFLVNVLKNEKKLLSLLLVPSGLFLYMTFLYFYIGDPLAFKNTQTVLSDIYSNVSISVFRGLVGSISDRYLLVLGIFGFIGSLYLVRKKHYSEGLFGAFIMLIPMISGLETVPRYIIGSVVLVLAVNDYISRFNKYKWLLIILLGALNILLLFMWYLTQPLAP